MRHEGWMGLEREPSVTVEVHVRPGEILGSGTLGTGCLLEVKDGTLGRWLEPGDLVTLAGDRLGRLETPIVVRPTA